MVLSFKLMKQTLEARVLGFIRAEGLVVPGEKLVVAVSGGADSVGLLLVLVGLQRELDIRLHVAHLDHRLRGAASQADARYVAGMARRLSLPATIESRDVRAYGRGHRLSLEEAAREVRYAFLAGVADAVGAGRVAVGHTAADHVETVLMHLVRGSGLGGLRGLRPLSRLAYGGRDITIIRPLLVLTRAETAAYCRQHRLRPRSDVSNLSTGPFRNRVRLRLLPELRKYNPRIDAALARLARLAADDLDFIEEEAAQRWGEVVSEDGEAVIMDRQKLAVLPPALRRHLLRAAVASRLGGLKDVEAGHIEDLLDALEKPAGKIVGLPGGLRLTVEHDRLLLGRDANSCPFPALEGEAALLIPGRTRLPGWEVQAEIVPPVEGQKYVDSDSLTAWLDFGRTGDKLTVRARRPGERLQPLGLGGTKELTEFMIDARIPRAWRPRIPVVTSPEQVVWVVGWRIDERVRVTGATRRVLRLSFTRV
jgi:tRNA(Ile)-lysidine synthase